MMQSEQDVEVLFHFIGKRREKIYEGFRPAHMVKDGYLTTPAVWFGILRKAFCFPHLAIKPVIPYFQDSDDVLARKLTFLPKVKITAK